MSIRALAMSAAAAAALAASPASAAEYLFDEAGDSFTIGFNGFVGDSPEVTIAGLTSSLLLKLTGGIGTNTLAFSYTLSNTSVSGGSGSRVSGFAFDANPNVANGTGSGTPGGTFTNINVNANYPNGIGNVEVCLTSNSGNSCAGGAGTGASLTTPATGTFNLIFGSNQNSVTLSDFYVRYQSLTGLSIDNQNVGSASGREVPPPPGGVPEPSTWAMLLIGFAAVGGTLRSRKSLSDRRLRVA